MRVWALFLWAWIAQAVPAHTGTDCENFSGTTGTTITCAKTITSGNLVVVVGLWDAPSGQTAGITDTASNTYTPVGSPRLAPSYNGAVQIFYSANVTGGSLTLTLTTSTSDGFRLIDVMEYSGLATSSPLDVNDFALSSGSGTAITCGSLITTQADELIVAGTNFGGDSVTAITNYTLRLCCSLDRVVSSTSTYTPGFTQTPSNTWSCVSASFKAPAAAPAIKRRALIL